MSADPGADLLTEYKEAFRIPSKLLSALQSRRFMPLWASRAAAQREDWLASLHKNVLGDGWPEVLRAAHAGLIERSNNIGAAVVEESAQAIVMPISTPAYLRELVEIANMCLVRPGSPDPDARMLIDPRLVSDAAGRLARTIGMLEETGYLDGPDAEWGGAVIAATRFLYYHELAHLCASVTGEPSMVPPRIVPGEEDIAGELAADQLALAMLTLEFRNHPRLRFQTLLGPVFALGLVAIKEFAEREYDGGVRRTRRATLRMSRIFFWAQRAELGDLVPPAEDYWSHLRTLLRQVSRIPSPVHSLLVQTADRPPSDWSTASNHVVRWCAFGDKARLLRTLRRVRDSARAQASSTPRASHVLEVLEFLQADTAALEPELGLRAAFCD